MKEITLTLTISEDAFLGMNNAVILLGDAAYAAFIGAKVPDKVSEIGEEKLTKRFYAVKDLYKVIESAFDK